MKSFTTLFALCFFLTVNLFAQDDRENSYILICEGNEASFSIDEYIDCNTVSIRDSENEVGTFLFVGLKKSKRIEIEIEGNILNDEAIAIVNKLKPPMKIRIEKVVDVTGTPLEGFRELTLRE